LWFSQLNFIYKPTPIPFSMKKYLWSTVFIAILVIVSFVIVMALDIPFMQDPSYIMEEGGLVAAGFSVLLLALDILLPVPGSVLMIANGAIFGVVVGTLLSMIGGLLATLSGHWLGRKGSKWLDRIATPQEQERARQAMERWGLYAVMISRPVPILSESILVMAAAMGLPLRKVLLAAIVGLLPASVLYAAIGAYALSVESNIWGFIAVIALTGIFWGIGQWQRRSAAANNPS